MSRPPAWPKGKPSPLRGIRHDWAGQWGGFDDGRSRLSALARRIERLELGEYPAGPARRRAAQLLALAEMTLSRIGSDPRATIRRVTALIAVADRFRARLEVSRNGHHQDFPARLAQLHREKANAGR